MDKLTVETIHFGRECEFYILSKKVRNTTLSVKRPPNLKFHRKKSEHGYL